MNLDFEQKPKINMEVLDKLIERERENSLKNGINILARIAAYDNEAKDIIIKSFRDQGVLPKFEVDFIGLVNNVKKKE